MLIIKKIRHFTSFIRVRNKSSVRVRFAPSPTGFLHVGGLRTALYNYLYAKARDGAFILRIEDTDQSRRVDGAVQQLQADLQWAGIEIDEGPYIQSERLQIYRDQLKVLLDNKSAYYCFCTDKRLDLLRKEAARSRVIPKYDNKCRHLTVEDVAKRLSRDEKYCVRFKLKTGSESFTDLIYGNVAYDVALNEGDPVILKSDGYPTYHFASVVDDHLMRITHVLRGVEWQISTTKHILIYRAFNWAPPTYAHLPLLINPDGTKLSKRQGDIKIQHYKNNGIYPLALINYITSSGGGFIKDTISGAKLIIYTIPELGNQFNLSTVHNHSGKLMAERLVEFNRLELQRQINGGGIHELISDVQRIVLNKFKNTVGEDELNVDRGYISAILAWAVDRIYRLSDLVGKGLAFVWIKPNVGRADVKCTADCLVKLCGVIAGDGEDDFSRERVNVVLKQFARDNSIDYGVLMRDLRTILSGLKEGPSVAEMMEILGKERTLCRIKDCLEK